MSIKNEPLRFLIECRDMPQTAEELILSYRFVKISTKKNSVRYEKIINIGGIKYKCLIVSSRQIYDIYMGTVKSPHNYLKIASRYEPKNYFEMEFLLKGTYRLKSFMTKKKSIKIN